MAELRHCPSCGDFFNYTGVREVCGKCGMNEERIYEEVYRFLRKRENRAATIERIVEMTEATEAMLHKWVRKGRLQPALFPNLGYPCDNCGKLTSKGKLCDECTAELKKELQTFEAATEFREAIQQKDKGTYLAERKK
ncbi:TIGR03826 family flagellar region protein [Sporosarcina sp. ZBG7A]|uniref:TIGR03826 family flagellar region protein n=1 Tax=Sporosarcina sp. ZBG7A TaxID=1582223 RepID=UPI00057A1271|nr:TIGR03826 family flagellar region protein [Sporosarcina sp. ZBG7A]